MIVTGCFKVVAQDDRLINMDLPRLGSLDRDRDHVRSKLKSSHRGLFLFPCVFVPLRMSLGVSYRVSNSNRLSSS